MRLFWIIFKQSETKDSFDKKTVEKISECVPSKWSAGHCASLIKVGHANEVICRLKGVAGYSSLSKIAVFYYGYKLLLAGTVSKRASHHGVRAERHDQKLTIFSLLRLS